MTAPLDLRVSHTFLVVDDHDKALAFYRDVLGWEVRNDVGFEGFRWLTFSPPSQPELEVVLESPGSGPDTSPADVEVITNLLAKGLMSRLVLTCDDVDATFERIAAAGADVVQEPIDQPYGVRDCAFRDPAGNLLRINQPKAR